MTRMTHQTTLLGSADDTVGGAQKHDETTPVAPRSQSPFQRRIDRQGYLLVGPAIAITLVLLLYPAVRSVIDSFRHYDLTDPDQGFAGLSNYSTVLTDPDFQRAILNTAGYLVVATACALVFGLVIALWLQRLGRFRMVALTLVILPWAVPGTVAGALWSLIFNGTSSGLLNSVLETLGLIETNQAWLVKPYVGILFLALSFIWSMVPISVVILLAALEAVPRQLYEAAAVDGSSPIRTFFSITVPLLRPSIAIVLLNAGVMSIGLFDQIFVLAGSDPERMTAIGQVYLYAFRDFDLGLGLAASVLATMATMLLSAFYLRYVYREVAYS